MREGFIITAGVACAPAVVFKNEPITFSKNQIPATEIANEVQLYQVAKERLHQQLLQEEQQSLSQIAKDFLDTTILFLIDPFIETQIEQVIKTQLVCAESAIMQCYHDYIMQLISTNNPFVLHNEFELRNLAETLVLELHKSKVVLPTICEDCILVCNNITPAQFLTLDTTKIKGVLLEDGNTNSHLAIVLRSTKIPTIFNVGNATKLIKPNTPVLIDAYRNKIYLNPEEELIWSVTKYAEKMSTQSEDMISPKLAQYKSAPDGERMRILANIGSVTELEKLNQAPSSGIGLFRTEFLFMSYTREPTEEEQYEVYKKIMTSLPPKYLVTFRTFDFNADKLPLYLTAQAAFNVSNVGSGGSAHAHKLLITQLRALLRAAKFGNMRIMFPMVSEYDEVKELVANCQQVGKELRAHGDNVPEIPVGVMIETPSGALMSAELAQIVDFFSIGTNDLTQYTEACNREAANHRNSELTPAVLKLIAYTVYNARRAKTPVCICGELVHNPNYLALLISLGLRDFSAAPFYTTKLLDELHSTEIKVLPHLYKKINKIRTKQEIIELNNALIVPKTK